MSWDQDLEARLRARYCIPNTCSARSNTPAMPATAVAAGPGFAVEIAGKVILTAPARAITTADQVPAAMRERWEKAATANPFYLWLSGRFVEAEKANANGAFWTTQDLQFGEMSVRHGPLNWLHQKDRVIGCIADNALITPAAAVPAQVASATTTVPALTTTTNYVLPEGAMQFAATQPRPRPYIAAVSAVWSWLHGNEARAVQAASDAGKLYYSMECIAREMACTTDGNRAGCGASFPYLQAMTQPDSVCEHIRARSCARRMVDPAFLGGAVIVPPVQPGWADARAEVMTQAAELAAQVAPRDADTSEWELLMATVLAHAQARP